MAELVDRPKGVRAGEELDAERVWSYLQSAIDGLDAPEVASAPLVVTQFPSGFSNLTYLLTRGPRELVLRRPPHGTKAKTAHDMGREYRMLRALREAFPYCPKVLAYCDDESTLGAPFYVMERIRGIVLRKALPEGLTLSAPQMRALSERLVDVQLELHAVDFDRIGLASYGKPEGYVARQVHGWSERYRSARTPDAPGFEEVMTWLAAEMPGERGAAIVHNDFKFDNVVLDPNDPLRIIGVLDWEMSTLGDPLLDLGCSLAYWVEKGDPPPMQALRMLPTNVDGALTRRELVARYADRSGLDPGRFDFYYAFGLFRLAVIAQQIYFRFFRGETKDERFRPLVFAVAALELAARRVIAEGAW